MIETIRWRILLVALAGWVNRHQLDVIDYLREENRVLKAHVGGRRLRLTDTHGILLGHRVLICDRDTKWSGAFRQTLAGAGIRVVQTPYRAPNCHAHAERFVRSIKEECLDRLVFLGEARLRRTLAEFAVHYYRERNHQGLQNRLIAPEPTGPPGADVRCRTRLGGLLRYYHRAA